MDFNSLMEMQDSAAPKESDYKVLNELFKLKGKALFTKTEIADEKKVKDLAQIYIVAKTMKINLILNYVDTYLLMMISLKRKGRNEFIRAFITDSNESDDEANNMISRLIGRSKKVGGVPQ